jgi:hypothetical protein
MRRACSTNEGKAILNKAKIHPVSKRINPLESANALYSIRKSDISTSILKRERMPNPRTDSSFQRFAQDVDFIKLMKKLGYE